MGILDLFRKKSSHPAGLPPIKISKELPTKIEDFEWHHYKVLRRLKNHPVNKAFTGRITLEVDIPRFIPNLIHLGLIKLGTYEESLNALKVDDLKSILKQHGLKVSGNKTILIERITENINEAEVRQSPKFTDIYVHTEITRPVIEASYDMLNEERSAFFNKVLAFILSGDMDRAYRMICKRNAEMPIPPGMGIDWRKEYSKGLKINDKNVYLNQLNSSSNKRIVAMAIYQSMGGALREAPDYKEQSSNDKAMIRSVSSSISSERHRKEYIDAGIKKYRFSACLDNETCPICGLLDGKIFDVDKIAPGINYPPMHDGCRCTTIAAWDDLPMKGTRFARDPVTHRGIQVPADMTYMDYKKEYLDK